VSILTLTGGQYGSEGKGVIASKIAPSTDLAVRTGGPNAGHSLIHEGRVWKMRSIPCAWTNPRCLLVIGAGAVIDPELLIHEVRELEAAGYAVRNRLIVDRAATPILPIDRTAEGHNSEHPDLLRTRIGSTAEGVGAARLRRIWRDPNNWVSAEEALDGSGISVAETAPVVNMYTLGGRRVMLEGTQGFGLSLSFGHWPYVTSANCHAAQLVADAGIGLVVGVPIQNLTVFRAYPIRVGGNSGPLASELTWEQMRERTGKPDLIEHTTVTGKVRRIGEFDWELAARAVLINQPSMLALTFADYIDPAVEGVTRWDQLTAPVRVFIDQMEQTLGVPVAYVGTGGPEWSVIDRTGPVVDSGHPRSGQDNGSPLPS